MPRVRRRPCQWTFLPAVTWDGLVRACGCRFVRKELPDGRDELVVGDIRSLSLSEVWRGKEVRHCTNASWKVISRRCARTAQHIEHCIIVCVPGEMESKCLLVGGYSHYQALIWPTAGTSASIAGQAFR